MLRILLVSPDKDAFSELSSALAQHDDVDLSWAECGATALRNISEITVDLIITDEKLGDMTGLAFAGKLLAVNPMINCAILSCLSPKKFHEASEGLGLMAQLPVKPGKAQAEALLQQLKEIKNLMSSTTD